MMRGIVATVVFVRDLATCTAFYRDTLKFQVKDNEPDSVGFMVGDLYFLLIEVSAAARLVSEESLDLKIEGGPRGFLAASVDDIDATYDELRATGVKFLRPPTDQAWGLRTAYFADPEGNLWEINQPIESTPAE